MQDLQTFYDWMIFSAKKGESTAYHYKSGLSVCSKDILMEKRYFFNGNQPLISKNASDGSSSH